MKINYKYLRQLYLFSLATLFLYAGYNSARAQDVSMDFSSGAIKLGAVSASCDSSLDGALRYNSTASQLQICDTGSWENLVSTADEATAPLSPNTGFFVLTKDRFDGNLGGRLGANDKCVSDLQTYDWLGKSTMQVDEDHVFAFICYGSYSCQDLMPNQTYTFAVSGDATLGGANFTTDSNSHGPDNNDRWNDNSHFGTGAKYYWMSERPASGSTKWANPDGNAGDNPNRCGGGGATGWDSNSAAQTGEAGRTAFTGKAETDGDRWGNSYFACNETAHLICMVNP